MKKLITIAAATCILLCLFNNPIQAQNKINGAKSGAVMVEETFTIQDMKLKNEISAYYSDYLRKQAAAEAAAEDLRRKIKEAMKQLQASDKLGNFEIQDLMSTYNQAETLFSQIHKKIAETKNAVVSKL